MEPTDTVELSAAMLERLELEADNATAGNVMANAIRTAYATSSDPFAGMNYGWADEDRDALAFVVGLVEEADEAGAFDHDGTHDIADAAVPIYTAELWNVATRLRDLFDEDEIDGFEPVDTSARLSVGLYLVASQILGALGDQ
jgi:hypothetical protein